MRKGNRSNIRLSLCLLAACLWPALAQAQTWNPTASDTSHNTAAGGFALYNHAGGAAGNTAIGYAALGHTQLTGDYNTASGDSALYFNTTGSSNTASGNSALFSNGTGSYNTASGASALHHNTTGSGNTASGSSALFSNRTGSSNTASGVGALFSNTTGNFNIASGNNALTNNTTGNGNIASGTFALHSNTTGSNNVAVGYGALVDFTSGNSNVALGANAGKNLKTGSSNIYIGHNGTAGGIESKVLRIGQVQTKTFIAGIKGVPVSGAAVVVRANGQLGVVASSARYKTGIRDLTGASDRLAQLRPVSYQYKTEPGVTHYGLIAEEVDKVMPELVVRDEENRPETVQYHELIPLLLQQVKAQRAQIERLTVRVDELSRARLAAR